MEKGKETNTLVKIFSFRHCASYVQYIGNKAVVALLLLKLAVLGEKQKLNRTN